MEVIADTVKVTGMNLPSSIQIQLPQGPINDWLPGIQLVLLMTLLMLGPSIVMLTTSFTRIVIVLSFTRNALGLGSNPSNQILIGLAFFLSVFLMAPVGKRIYEEAVVPYNEKKINTQEAIELGSVHLKRFMLEQTREKDLEFFLHLAQPATAHERPESLSLSIVIPAFILSELRTAFQMGFMIFIPFLLIDFLVASTLMAMGMMMMPPAILSLPFKILLFVLVDGWSLIVQSLVKSFSH